jgi:ankyrin repeat protein
MTIDSDKDCEHQEYTDDKELPFGHCGNHTEVGPNGRITRVIGVSGRFESVEAARKTFLVKVSNICPLEEAKKLVMKEARLLHKARHGHVVKLLMTYFYLNKDSGKTYFAIVMDVAEGTLRDYLPRGLYETDSRERSSKKPHREWFGCLINAVSYIHRLKIQHRDIKPENILIKNERVLLADFGISGMGHEGTLLATRMEQPRSRTPEYCAPEVDENFRPTYAEDVFSLGAVFLELLLACYSDSDGYLYNKLAATVRGNHDELSNRSENQIMECPKSFSKNLDAVLNMIDEIKIHLSKGLKLEILLRCHKMLSKIPDDRPQSDDLQSVWALRPLTMPLMTCGCHGYSGGLKHNDFKNINESLLDAYKKGLRLTINLLKKRGASVSMDEAFVAASEGGLWDVVDDLLEQVNVLAKGSEGRTALHFLAGRENGEDHLDIACKLLNKGANIKMQDDQHQTALRLAAKNGYARMVLVFLRAKFPKYWSVNYRVENLSSDALKTEIKTVLDNASAASYRNEILMGLQARRISEPGSEADGAKALSEAAKSKHDIVQVIADLPNIERADKDGQTPLLSAAAQGNYRDVELLLIRGANIEARDLYGYTPLLRAAANGHTNVVKLLLHKRPDVDAKGDYQRTALSEAAMYGYDDIVKLLLDNRAGLRMEDTYGQTPLFVAASKGHQAVAKTLLDADASAWKTKDKKNHTPLVIAAINGHESVIKLLLDRMTNVKREDMHVPLLEASGMGHRAVVELLLSKGAQIEAQDESNRTPLLRATMGGHILVVKFLLDRDADITARDKKGHTPLQIAAINGHDSIGRLLSSRKSKFYSKFYNLVEKTLPSGNINLKLGWVTIVAVLGTAGIFSGDTKSGKYAVGGVWTGVVHNMTVLASSHLPNLVHLGTT